jgi:insertion element IS1 protein InsB
MGDRSAKTVKKLYKMLKKWQIDTYCTDEWKAFKQVFLSENHPIGKPFTKYIEGVNTSLRARNRRWVRKPTCFSKKEENHQASIVAMFLHSNNTKMRC